MKKKLQLLVLGLCCIYALNAQTSYSLKGGLGFAGATAKANGLTFTADAVIQPQLGVIADLAGTGAFNWQTGLLINTYGGKYSSDGGSATGSIYTLSVPFLGRYKFADKFYGYAGPQLSLSVSASTKSKEGNISKTDDINSGIKKPLLFGILGGGYEINEKFTAFGEYHFGLSNANADDGATSSLNLLNFGVIYSLSK